MKILICSSVCAYFPFAVLPVTTQVPLPSMCSQTNYMGLPAQPTSNCSFSHASIASLRQRGRRFPDRVGPDLHGTKTIDLLQFDYIKMSESPTGEKYVLALFHDHSGYRRLYPTASTDVESSAHAILD